MTNPERSAADSGMSDPARTPVGRVPLPGLPAKSSPGVSSTDAHSERPPPRRLRRLHRVWPDRDGNISYLLTPCVEGRQNVLANEPTFERLITFLIESPARYRWYGRRFVVMPDHIHLIARMGHEAVRLSEWMKALKAVVGGLVNRRSENDAHEGRVRVPGLQSGRPVGDAGPIQTPGVASSSIRIPRAWSWQKGFHDHKFRTRESEARKWEYVCLNPVRAGLVKTPEEWPFGGEIFYDDPSGPSLVRGTPPLLDAGVLIEDAAPEHGNGGKAG